MIRGIVEQEIQAMVSKRENVATHHLYQAWDPVPSLSPATTGTRGRGRLSTARARAASTQTTAVRQKDRILVPCGGCSLSAVISTSFHLVWHGTRQLITKVLQHTNGVFLPAWQKK